MEKGEPWMLTAVAADRGMCGAINSMVAREARRLYYENAVNHPTRLIVIGTKPITAMQRLFEKDMVLTVSDQKPGKRMTFKQVSVIAELIRATEWSRMDLVYNKYKNAIAYITTREPFFRLDTKAPVPQNLASFELEGDQDVLRNLDEFRMLVRFWNIWAENEAVEVSSRVNAMESSNKAAGEIADKLNIKANKLRQAKITLEICDIVAGAETAV